MSLTPVSYEAFRIINKADGENLYDKYNDESADTPRDTAILDMAERKAEDIKYKSALTVALEDYTDVYDKQDSYIDGLTTEHVGEENKFIKFFKNIGRKLGFNIPENIFKNDTAESLIKREGEYTQDDILKDAIKKDGGLRYAKDNGEDLYESALCFAKADIDALETPLTKINTEYGNYRKGGKLTSSLISEFNSYPGVSSYELNNIKLSKKGKNTLSPEEMASYIVAADTNRDGLITQEESQAVKKHSNQEDLEKNAQQQFAINDNK